MIVKSTDANSYFCVNRGHGGIACVGTECMAWQPIVHPGKLQEVSESLFDYDIIASKARKGEEPFTYGTCGLINSPTI